MPPAYRVYPGVSLDRVVLDIYRVQRFFRGLLFETCGFVYYGGRDDRWQARTRLVWGGEGQAIAAGVVFRARP